MPVQGGLPGRGLDDGTTKAIANSTVTEEVAGLAWLVQD